jgi:S1-C subfamily serine protease
MHRFSRPLVLAAVLVLPSVAARAAEGLPKAEVARRGKAATALVLVQSGRASGSAFCVHPSGLFVTNEHVVREVAEAQLVLRPGEKDQKVLKAVVVRKDPELDLALLRAEGEKALPALPLGSDENLSELADVVACGFPLGQGPSPSGKEYPTVSVHAGTVAALRRKEGVLQTIRLDVELDPGNSGGPILDFNGTVVGVALAGDRGSRVSFAVPVSRLVRFVEKPDLQLVAPGIDKVAPGAEVRFEVRAASVLPSSRPLELGLTLRDGSGVEHRHKMQLAGDVYRVSTVPVPAAAGPPALRLRVTYADGSLTGSAEDCALTLGAAKLKLSDIRSLRFGPKPRATLRDGREVEGAFSGPGEIAVRLGGNKVAVNLPRAEELSVQAPDAVAVVTCTVVATRDGKEVGRLRRVFGAGARAYLVDLPESGVKQGPWPLGKGITGDPNKTPISFGGKAFPKGLGLHPGSPPAPSSVQYSLGGLATVFQARVAFDDTNRGLKTGDTVFQVFGDGKLLWQSKPITTRGEFDECVVDVKGVQSLELRVAVVTGTGYGAHAVWLDPVLLGADSAALKKQAGARE